MLNEEQQQQLQARVKPLQMIVAAQIFGLLVFAVVALVNHSFAVQFQFELLSMIGFAFTVPSVLVSFVTKKIVLDRSAQNYLHDTSSDTLTDKQIKMLLGLFSSHTVIASALIEGAAFFWIMIYFVADANAIGLIMALPLAGLHLFNIPTENRVLNWIENQIHRISRPF